MADVDEAAQRKTLITNGWNPLALIGEGGAGRVFKVVSSAAVHRFVAPLLTPMDRDAAIQQALHLAELLDDIASGSQVSVAAAKVAKTPCFRTKREIRILQEIAHPNLIAPLAIDQSADPSWYVMPLMRGGTLASNSSKFRGASTAVLRGMNQVAEALSELHQRGIVHRDIKPANIFLGVEGKWIVGDLGVAYLSGDDDLTTTRPVSRDWFPRWLDDELGHSAKVDLYMLAATAISLLVGKKVLDPSHFRVGGIHLPTALPDMPGVQDVQTLLAQLFVQDPGSLRIDARELAAQTEDLVSQLESARNRRLHAHLAQPQLVFQFGRSNGVFDSGDHPGLQMIPAWVPHGTKTVRIWIKFDERTVTSPYKVEFWSPTDPQQLAESPFLANNTPASVPLPDHFEYGWCRVRVSGHGGNGTSSISALSIHAIT